MTQLARGKKQGQWKIPNNISWKDVYKNYTMVSEMKILKRNFFHSSAKIYEISNSNVIMCKVSSILRT